MAGKKGMHERATTSPTHAAAVRSRIKAGVIVDRLEKHVVGKVEMSATQVAAGLGLLRKVIPDMAAMEHTGPGGEDLFAALAEKSEALRKAWRDG